MAYFQVKNNFPSTKHLETYLKLFQQNTQKHTLNSLYHVLIVHKN